jgi:hypothetical protein
MKNDSKRISMTPENEVTLESLERKLNSLMLRVADLDRRLRKVEQKVFPQPARPLPKSQPRQEGTRHSYLAKAISSAKRDYEQRSG